MATKSNFTARLPHLGYLRELVAGMGFTLTRGRGAGEVGSIQAFLNAMSSGEVVAFPLIADATDMMAVASRIDEIAAAEMDMTTDVLRYCTASLRSAAARVIELDAAEVGDESDALRLAAGKLGRYADAESAMRSAVLALFSVVIRFDDGSYDWHHADRPTAGRHEIVARRDGVGPWQQN